MRGELRGWSGVHVLLQVLAEELEYQVELLLAVHHIQQPGQGHQLGRSSQLDSDRPSFPTALPTSPDDVGVLQLFEQGDLPDGSAWDPLSLPAEKEGTAVEAGC